MGSIEWDRDWGRLRVCMGGLDPATDLMNEQSFPEMKEGFYTILFQSQARGEAEVGRDDRLVEVVDVQHSEPGGVSLGTGGAEGDGVVGGSGPHGTEGGSDQVGVGGAIVVDGGGGFVHPHHLRQTEPAFGIVGEGDEVADG